MKKYRVAFRSSAFSYPGGQIECAGANFVNIYVTPAHVAAGVTVDGAACFAGLNEFKCPTPKGILSNPMQILIPGLILPKLTVRIGFIEEI